MTPILTKYLGINQELNLEQVLNVWQVAIDAKSETIKVVYEVLTLSPTGVVIKTQAPLEYVRYNDPKGQQMFDYYKNSPIGQGIIVAINETLINYPNLDQSSNILSTSGDTTPQDPSTSGNTTPQDPSTSGDTIA